MLRPAHLVLVTGLAIGAATLPAGCGTASGHAAPSSPRQLLQRAMLVEAQAGHFQAPPHGYSYGRPVECRVDRPHAFHGADIYLCKIAVRKLSYAFLWEWGAWSGGRLHTHASDPGLIPTITGPFDPPW